MNEAKDGYEVSRETVSALVLAAIKKMFEEDQVLFEIDVNECTLSHMFAVHLRCAIKKWNEAWDVDCEYNRDGQDRKKAIDELARLKREKLSKTWKGKEEDLIELLSKKSFDDSVFPDVIVHIRTGLERYNNLLVVEIKKNDNKDRWLDYKKLELFTSNLGTAPQNYDYQHGLFLEFQTWMGGGPKEKMRAMGIWYQRGMAEKNGQLTLIHEENLK